MEAIHSMTFGSRVSPFQSGCDSRKSQSSDVVCGAPSFHHFLSDFSSYSTGAWNRYGGFHAFYGSLDAVTLQNGVEEFSHLTVTLEHYVFVVEPH